MAVKACKKCDPHEICEECPEWIFTLADLIMCMMGLFVILWVLKPSVAPAEKSKADEQMMTVIGEIRKGFGWIPDPTSSDPIDQFVIRQMALPKVPQGRKESSETDTPRTGMKGTSKETTIIRPGLISGKGGRLGFTKGDGLLSPETSEAVKQIADLIRGHRMIVLVKGHASLDDLGPAGTPEQFMELSLRRARAVSDELIHLGVNPDILRVQGCGVFEPVKQKAYNEDRLAQNRRVEVEATSNLVEERQDVGE